MTSNPWRELRAHEEVRLRFSALPDGILGATLHERHSILIDKRLPYNQRRCVLAHELAHLERGPVPCIPWLAAKEEAICDRIAARRLLPIGDLIAAARWCESLGALAEELDVTEDVLSCRLDHLTPAERATIEAALTI